MRVGVDIDGILADFNTSYIALLNRVSGKEADIHYVPTQWSYERSLGFTKDDIQAAWEQIKSNDFWHSLDMMPGVEYGCLCDLESHDLYFVTTRPGEFSKTDTESWLNRHLGVECPTVLISNRKGHAAYALELDYFIDDKIENVWDVQDRAPNTKAYLLDRPWNQPQPNGHGSIQHRVKSLEEFIGEVNSRGL